MDEGGGSDAVLSVLAGQRRRDILAHLLETETGAVAFRDLVTHLVEREPDPESPDRKTVAGTLHHVHLPVLAEVGLVDYESERGPVAATARAEQYERVLTAIRRVERDRSPERGPDAPAEDA